MNDQQINKPELNILFASDMAGHKGLAAAGASVLFHKSDAYRYVITTNEIGLTDEVKRDIEESWTSIDETVIVRWIRADRDRLMKFRKWGGDNLTYARLYLAEIFDSSRVLYLDIDVVATTNVEEIYESDLEGKVMGAVFQENADHFNAGVLLIDVEKWKAKGIQEKVTGVLLNRPEFMDQDALNFIFPVGEWKELGAEWNACNTSHPGSILHYRTHVKPWESTEEKFDLFYFYLDLTKYKGWRSPLTVVRKDRSSYESLFNRAKWKLQGFFKK